MGWIGVDLDGTLAQYSTWKDGEIGEPIPAMLERVKEWIAQGREVRIVTARVGDLCNMNASKEAWEYAIERRAKIEEWLIKHVGCRLAVIAYKDFGMEVLYDDRAIQVEKNTGRLITER